MVQSATPKCKFGEAIGYFQNQSTRLRQFLTTARLDLDNNILERSIRPIAVGLKNWIFAGSEEGAKRAALLMSLVGSCRLIGIDPGKYLGDVLLRARIRKATAEACTDLPHQWKTAQTAESGIPRSNRGDYRGVTYVPPLFPSISNAPCGRIVHLDPMKAGSRRNTSMGDGEKLKIDHLITVFLLCCRKDQAAFLLCS